jgi:hypothetical protein
MKTASANLFSQISKTETDNLTTQVKETLAMGYAQNNTKTFSAAELWNIQRQRRSFVQRRAF